jgi:hypothetical protein
VHPQHIGPQLLVAEGVEAEDGLPISMSLFVLVSRVPSKLLTHLVGVFAGRLPADQVATLLRQTGKSLADELALGKPLSGSLRSRVLLASELLNEQLGSVTDVEENGGYVIRGVGCPLPRR